MKLIISFSFLLQIVVCNIFSQTDLRYTESIKEVQEYLLNNDYAESLYILRNLEKEGYANANMDYLMGYCYINSMSNNDLSINYLERANKFVSKNYNPDNPAETDAPAIAILYLGDAYLINNKIKEARLCYLRYQNIQYLDENQKDIARSRLKNCLFARLQINNPLSVKLENVGKLINSGIANSDPCISADGNKMVFMRTMKFYDALFFTTKTDTGWIEPQNITTQTGSDGEFIPTALSPDGTRLLLKSFFDPNGIEIYESIYNGRKWTKAKRLNAPINSKYQDIDASYGADGTTIFFSSNRAGGTGGYDIYKATLDLQTQIYNIENLGNTINTIGDEKSPSIIENGKVLVFNSNYRNSIGGYDYYYSQLLNDNKWSEPLDVGYPINSTFNDNDLKFSASSPKKGLLSRYDTNGNSGNDIFIFDCPAFSTLKLIPLSGNVKINDSISDYKNITLALVDVAEKDTSFIFTPNDDGSYFAELYPGKFDLIIKRDGEKDIVQDFSIPKNFVEESFPLETKIEMPIAIEQIKQDTIFVADVLFDFNQFEINAYENKILSDLTAKLNRYTIKNIQLKGYTDALGSELYNKALSTKRAENVKEFIKNQGNSNTNIIIEGKGSSQFVAKNTKSNGFDNPEGRSYNRRVEIYITVDSNIVVIVKKDRVPKKLKIKN